MIRKGCLLFAATLFLSVAPTFGQDIYQMESLTTNDLNGTARYVGMGGAMSALGADISVMGTNPAGIGLYRRSEVVTSFSLINLDKGEKFDGQNPTYLSFDNIGFVYSLPYEQTGTVRFFNFGFNYHKKKDFNQLLNIGQQMPGASQTWQMADLAYAWGENYVPFAFQGYDTYLISPIGEADENGYYPDWGYFNALSNRYRKAQSGSIQAFDFNFSCNINDMLYLGLTIGAYSVDMDNYSIYQESLDVNGSANYSLVNNRSLHGSAFDVKIGTIVRPIEESPFRIGLSVSTPTYYSLRNEFNSYIQALYGSDKLYRSNRMIEGNSYNLITPWKFNISLGHTIGSVLALGAEYEYADYSTCKVTYDDVDWYWGDYETDDNELRRESRRHLKGVSTFKLGAEARLSDNISLRAGYNHVSAPFGKSAYLNLFNNSPSVTYASESNYMNLSDINRYTCGLGYRTSHFYLDMAYQFAQQNGTFYPFNTQREYSNEPNQATPSKVNLDKHQVILTLGYKF